MPFDPNHLHAAPLFASMVRDSETGELNWPLIAVGLITAGVIGAGTMLSANASEISAIKARQEIVLQRLTQIESSQHPATSKRYTSDDADRDRVMMQREIGALENRMDRCEVKHK